MLIFIFPSVITQKKNSHSADSQSFITMAGKKWEEEKNKGRNKELQRAKGTTTTSYSDLEVPHLIPNTWMGMSSCKNLFLLLLCCFYHNTLPLHKTLYCHLPRYLYYCPPKKMEMSIISSHHFCKENQFVSIYLLIKRKFCVALITIPQQFKEKENQNLYLAMLCISLCLDKPNNVKHFLEIVCQFNTIQNECICISFFSNHLPFKLILNDGIHMISSFLAIYIVYLK